MKTFNALPKRQFKFSLSAQVYGHHFINQWGHEKTFFKIVLLLLFTIFAVSPFRSNARIEKVLISMHHALTKGSGNGESCKQIGTSCNPLSSGPNSQMDMDSDTYASTTLDGPDVNTDAWNSTLQNSFNTSTSVTACDYYIWVANNQMYTASGTYTHTTQNGPDVDTETLHLTINTPTITTTSETACSYYIWNGMAYHTSGTFTYTYNGVNNAPCVNTEILNLTISKDTIVIATVTSCNSYTWGINNINYSTSGIYTVTSVWNTDCIRTDVLNVTINYTNYGSANAEICNINPATGLSSYTWPLNGVTYTASGLYTHTIVGNGVSTGNQLFCDSIVTLNLNLVGGVTIAPKAFLNGAYDANTGLMKDSLRRVTMYEDIVEPNFCVTGNPLIGPAFNVIPQTTPDFNGGDNKSFCDGNRTIPSMFYNTMGTTPMDDNSIVDWVHVKLRPASNLTGGMPYGSKYCLIQRDGDIVDVDGVSPVSFPCVCPGSYYVEVDHRNHLAVMSANPMMLSSSSTNQIDFTIPATSWVSPQYPNGMTNPPVYVINGVAVMWGGDTKNDKNVRFNGGHPSFSYPTVLAGGNDKEVILAHIFQPSPACGQGNNNILYRAYKNSDANMDGKVKYNNPENDKDFILSNILLSAPTATPNTKISQHTP
jgi:hypothetical protein